MPQFPLLENETKFALNKGNLLGASLVDSVNAWPLVVNAGCPDNPMGPKRVSAGHFFPGQCQGKASRKKGIAVRMQILWSDCPECRCLGIKTGPE